MEIQNAKKIVAETGKMLLDQGLVARTWGNVSCRIDENTFAITPSGLGYVGMKADDIAVVDINTMEWKGTRKPSGEKKIHKAAYEVYPEVNFVIHTHQTYATALGLAGYKYLDITEEEEAALGGLALADYGLPGTKKLTEHVFTALLLGSKVVLMAHHGALICGKSREETFRKAILLEEICKRNIKCAKSPAVEKVDDIRNLKSKVKQLYPISKILDDEVMLQAAANGSLKAQLDDMAQMVGGTLKCVSINKALAALLKHDAVLVKGVGAIVKSNNEDDMTAMGILVEKAAICSLHAKALNTHANLLPLDTTIMRMVYKLKYSKQK